MYNIPEVNEEYYEDHLLNQYLDDQDEDEEKDENTFEPDYFDYRILHINLSGQK